MSVETIGLLSFFMVCLGAIVIAAYMGYRYKSYSDENDRLHANETARKESDAKLQELKDLPNADLDKRGSDWMRH